MVMVVFWLLDCNVWLAQAERLLVDWPQQTGRVCPTCGAKALVGHGRRRRSVHAGTDTAPDARWPVCLVLWFEVQRVRCTGCGKTHTLLPAFLARYQRHPNLVRQEAVRLREAGRSWKDVLAGLQPLGVPLRSATSARRWVQGVLERMGAAAAELRRRGPGVNGQPHYGSVERPGSWAEVAELVRAVVRAEGGEQPAGEELAALNRLGRGRWAV